MNYIQCELSRTFNLGNDLSTTTSHIPSNLAKVGRFVELKEKDGTWKQWQVTRVSSHLIDEKSARKLAKCYHEVS